MIASGSQSNRQPHPENRGVLNGVEYTAEYKGIIFSAPNSEAIDLVLAEAKKVVQALRSKAFDLVQKQGALTSIIRDEGSDTELQGYLLVFADACDQVMSGRTLRTYIIESIQSIKTPQVTVEV